MLISKWLTVNSKGSCRLTSGKPRLARNEITVRLELNLPKALFEQPSLEAKITVPDDAIASKTIESVVADNVQEVIQQATGLTFAVDIVQHAEAPTHD